MSTINKFVYFCDMTKTYLKDRNQALRRYFDDLCKKYPEWRLDALEEKTAKQFYISQRTVRAILKEQGCYGV